MSRTDGPDQDMFHAGGRALRHNELRRANERTVMTVIGFNNGVSNAEISRLSGLAPQTVSAILIGLERDGLVTRGPVLRGRRGQPATPIHLNAEGGYAIGVELGWRQLDVILLNLHGEVLGHRQQHYPFPDPRTMVDAIATFADDLRSLVPEGQESRLTDIGVAMPGRMADNLDLLTTPEELVTLWRALDLTAALSERTGLDASIINDGNAACWAELIALPQPRPANILYFLVSHFVGAGIIGDGQLWDGPNGNAANLGSMLVMQDDGEAREAHSIASVSALAKKLSEGGTPHDPRHWAQWDWPAIEDVVDTWLDDGARALARTTFNASTVVEAPLLVIDTILHPEITERLAERLQAALDDLPVRNFARPKVVRGRYGAMAPAVGAAELPLFRRYF